MRPKVKAKGAQFERAEKALPLCTRDGGDLQDPLLAIQGDIGALMKQLAGAKQALSENERLHQDQVEDILHHVLEVMDAFDRVFASVDKKKEHITAQMKMWLNNFRTISRLARRILDIQGVAPIENLDDGFDPRWHKVVETVTDPLKVDGFIVEIVRKGYVWKSHVLRRTEVIVVRNAGETEAAYNDPMPSPAAALSEDGKDTE